MIRKLSKAQILAIGFFLIILVGALLLMLPIAAKDRQITSFHDTLFTAVSATCVTGLIVADTYEQWSLFGQIIILCLIQTGGLGFITMVVFVSVFLKRKIGLKERNLIQESINTLQLGGVVRLVKKIVFGTLVIEGIGAVILSLCFIPQMGIKEGIWNGIFHAVSAFCNAGFDLMGKYEPYSSFTYYYDDVIVNVVIMLLIIIGGIGFIVWDDLLNHKLHIKKYMLHTKIVLLTTVLLIFGGAILFYIFEKNNVLAPMGIKEKLLSCFFASVTARTAGFNTTDTSLYTPATIMLNSILMFIGGSPGSTAGGIKTTTVVVLLLTMISYLRNRWEVNIFGRRLGEETLRKATTVVMLNLTLSFIVIVTICGIQALPLEDVIFEVSSAIGTVGMTTGITRELTLVSRYLIILLMYCGRIGSISFALSFLENKKKPAVKLPQERITIG